MQAFDVGQAVKYGQLAGRLALYYLQQGQSTGAGVTNRELLLVSDYGDMRRAATGEMAAAIFWEVLMVQAAQRIRRIRKRAETDIEAMMEIVALHDRVKLAVAELEAIHAHIK